MIGELLILAGAYFVWMLVLIWLSKTQVRQKRGEGK